MEDPFCKAVVSLDISVPDFIICDGLARFLNSPRIECEGAAAKIKQLIGADMGGPFRDILHREFLGPKGCDTLFNMVNVSGRAIVFAYLAWRVRLGPIPVEQYQKIFKERTGCVADLAHPTDGPAKRYHSFTPKDWVPALHEPGLGAESTAAESGDENEPIGGRRIILDYFELSDTLWRARAHVVDFEHSIFVTLDISTADLVVRDANITFLRQPYKGCNWMQSRIKKIVGACLATDFKQRVRRDLLGLEGCGNVYVLLNTLYHPFIQFYLSRNTIMGKMTPEQKVLSVEGLRQDCIACGV